MASSSSSSSSSSDREEWKYDVFLSFRGKDTRNSFTSHLYKELCRKGIITFKDDRELTKGEPLPLELPLAIDQSRILLIIFSKNYATSTWCLEELFQISKRKEAGGRQIVLPIFYDVTPSDVRYQTGDFGAAFNKHEDDSDKVQQWRIAAKQIADLSGWELKDKDESDFIEEIVRHIIHVVMSTLSHSIAKDFVGMKSRLENMIWYLDLGQLDNVKIIGICGMGGIGKTTIASVVYKELSDKFEGRCFLADVRETSAKYGLVYLQNQLLSATLMESNIDVYDCHRGADQIRHRLSRKKLLVILDDVSKLDQMEILIGRRGETWFGPGSRIIITTRDESLLIQQNVDEIYRVKELNDHESLQLFRSKAIQNSSREEEYAELCREFVKYAGGLPLALIVLGSSLYSKSVIRDWKSMLDRLKEVPNEEILSKLQISFDGLEGIQKKIFLDIACFFNGHEEDYVINILNSCRMFPECGMTELKEKSLITVSDGVLKMHDLLQEMGRQIVLKESLNEPGQRSRIWLQDDFLHVMRKDTGTEQTEGIVLNEYEPVDRQDENLSAKAFSQMKKLRLLILRNLQFSQDNMYLSNELAYLNWYGCPFKYFPPAFQPNKLVELHLQRSCIEYLWKSIKPVKHLKIMNLSFSKNLIKTPDFKEVPNLENLNLQGCVELLELHESIGALEKLVSLNLKDCKKLVSLPTSMCILKSLKILNLSGCLGLVNFLGTLGISKCLEELDVAGIGVMQLLLTGIRGFLQLFRSTPESNPFALPTLTELNLSYIRLPEGAIPSDWSRFPSLGILDLSGNDFLSIPSTISQLSRLISLKATNCKRLQSLPDLPSSIKSLNVKGCKSLESLPDLFPLAKLKYLEFGNCTRLQSLPPLPSSVKHLTMENCTSLQTLPMLSDKLRLCGKRRSFYIGFSNCSKLNDNQEEVDMISTWLESYLLWVALIRCLMKHYNSCQFWNQCAKFCKQKCWNPATRFPEFYTCFPGSEIPNWFNHQNADGPYMLIQLSPDENLRNIAGFAVCAVVKSRPKSQPDWWLEVSSKNRELQTWFNVFPVSGDSALIFDHLSMFFVFNHRLDYPSEESRPIQLKFLIRGDEFEKCGIRIVLDEDLQKMYPFSISVANPEAGCSDIEDLPPPCRVELKDEGD